jgi:AraC-like DNA-binding protein
VSVDGGASPDDAGVSERGRPDALRGEAVRALLAAVEEPQRRELLSRIADLQARGGTAAALAAELGLNDKALQRQCQRLGIPQVRHAFVWLRMVWAARLLEEPGATVDGVAAALGYAAPSVLRRAFRAYLGLSTNELRQQGPLRVVLEHFRAELDTLRPRPRRQWRRRGSF